MTGLTRTQRLVLGFGALAWGLLATLLVASPEIYDRALRLGPGGHAGADLGFLGAVSVFLAMLCVGVVRRWRWVFWLVALAFVAGVARVPVALLQLGGVIPTADPSWYVLLQAAIGVVQCVIGVAMLAGYRRGGCWADV